MSLADFHFIRPYWLIVFIPYVVVIALMFRSKLGHGNWSSVCDAALLPYLLQEKEVNQSRWPMFSGAIAALLVITALAGPTWERLPAPVFRNDSALVIALDLSRSMDAEDIKPSRLIRARYKIADILKKRKDGQTALLVYAGDAFTVTPLTDDIQTIDSQLEALNTNIMPSQGSNTAAVLDKAVDLFKQAGLQKGQIILITDDADVNKTLPAVKSLDGYTLSILGVGTLDGAPISIPEGGFLKDGQDTIVVAKLNENELITLAEAGHGVYHAITADDSDIQSLLATVDKPTQLQGKENQNLLLDLWSDKGPWLLLPVLPLAALMFRKGLFCFALLLILPLPRNSYAFDWQDLWKTTDQQAQQAYNVQQFEQAAQLFENPDWKAAAQYKAGNYEKALETLKKSHQNASYNQGNALAQSGKLEEAVKAYEKALAENANDEDAKYNKDLVEKELKKKQQEKKQQDKQDQQKDDKQQSSKDNSEQNQDKQDEKEKSEQSDEQKNAENKSERKPSESEESSEQQQQADKPEEKKQEEGKEAKQAKQQDQDKDKEDKPPEQKPDAMTAKEQLTDETKQANEQWLKRIPDDPAGLLKRKFRYQYGQRQHPSGSETGGW
jgi:Ca-activated chloride channel family protein